MKRLSVGGAVALTLATPCWAGYSLVPAGVPTTVAKSGLTVTADRDWDKQNRSTGKNAESWTLDGLSLNDLSFFGGIGDGETLFREVNKKNKPLPRFSRTMLAPDIAQLFEQSYRISVDTPIFTVDSIEPATFLGRRGFRFDFSYVAQNDEVRRKGEAFGAIADGKLYLISYTAPAITYFDRDLANFRSVATGAKLATPG